MYTLNVLSSGVEISPIGSIKNRQFVLGAPDHKRPSAPQSKAGAGLLLEE
jgi:hypothetical protein